MALFPLLAVFLVACIHSDVIAAGQDEVWKSRPGTVVNKWEGEDLKLNWSLKQDKYVQVESIQWFNEKSTRTLMLYNVDSNTSKIGDDYYKDRVVLLQDTNAGIILRNLTKADEGGYLINVEGPSILKQDTANVRVHNVWESRPGNVTAWEGGNLVLDWSLKQDAYIRVESIQWFNENSTRTIMIHNIASNSSKVGDDYYTGRVELLTGTNAGVILRNVTKADEGWYLINVAGPSILQQDRAYAIVRKAPRVQIDNEDVSPGVPVDRSQEDQSSVTVLTSKDLTANITIVFDGVVLESCQDDRLCTAIVQLDKFPSTTLPLHISVNNGEGDRLELKYNITNERGHVVEANSSLSKTTVILIIITVLLLLVIIVMLFIILWLVFRNRQLNDKPLTDWQIKYIKYFIQSKRDRNVTGRVADPQNAPELEHLTGRNEKDGDAKPETGKEIIESDKKECDVSVSIQEEGSQVPENYATDETVQDKKSDHVEDESDILKPDNNITFDNSINVINPENGISSPSSVTDQDGPVIHI